MREGKRDERLRQRILRMKEGGWKEGEKRLGNKKEEERG